MISRPFCYCSTRKNHLKNMKKSPFGLIVLDGDSLGARTPDPLIKSQQGMLQIIQHLQALLESGTFFIRQFYGYVHFVSIEHSILIKYSLVNSI